MIDELLDGQHERSQRGPYNDRPEYTLSRTSYENESSLIKAKADEGERSTFSIKPKQ